MFPAWCPSCPRAAGTVRAGALSAGPAGLDRHGNAVCSVTRRTPARISRKCSSMRTSPVRRPCVRTGASRSFFRRNAREKAVSGAHLPHHRCRHGDGVILQAERYCRPAGAGAAQIVRRMRHRVAHGSRSLRAVSDGYRGLRD